MVYFISNTDRHHYPKDLTLTAAEARESFSTMLIDLYHNGDYLGFDFETTGLDATRDKPLLLSTGTDYVRFVIDCTTVDVEALFKEATINILGHNLKFDLSYLHVHYPKIRFCGIYDTMIAEQKLYQNTSRSFSLEQTTIRYCNTVPAAMVKDVRKSFIGADPRTIAFTKEQIEYAGADVEVLHKVKDKQVVLAKQWKLYDWLLHYEFPLIDVLCRAELKGFELDVPALRAIIKDNTDIKNKTAIALDAELRRLRDTILPEEERNVLRNGKYDRTRNEIVKPEYEGLFGPISEFEYFHAAGAKNAKADKKKGTVKFNENVGNINWGSADEIIEIFAKLKQPVPLQGEAERKYGYLIPVVNSGRIAKWCGITRAGKQVDIPNYDTEGEGFTVSKKAFIKYFIDIPNTPMRTLIKLLEEYNRASHEISSFGENFINNINPATGRIHTKYRQCEAINGRLQSGGGKSGESDKINFQNIPRDAKFRHLFKAGNGYSVVTCDLTGAEVTFMCDKANDEVLYNWAVVNDDSHSPMVQNVWRHIYLYRAGLLANCWSDYKTFIKGVNKPDLIAKIKESNNLKVKEYYDLALHFVVSKKDNKPYRQAGKNGTFGGIYGMKAKKAQETFNGTDIELAKVDPNFKPVNVTLEEGNVILYAQRKSIPKTFAMVEKNVQTAFNQGYLVLNDTSYSRIWFEEVINFFKLQVHQYGENIQLKYQGYGKYEIWSIPEANEVPEYLGEEELDWRVVKDVDGQSRNVPISGTQADCVKMAMVVIDLAITQSGYDCFLLSQVHDELVYGCPKDLDGVSDEWHNSDKYFIFYATTEQYAIEVYKDNTQAVKARIGSILHVSFPLFVKLAMIQCANVFLKNVEMQAAFEVHDTWTK